MNFFKKAFLTILNISIVSSLLFIINCCSPAVDESKETFEETTPTAQEETTKENETEEPTKDESKVSPEDKEAKKLSDEALIKSIIDEYFKLKYESQHTLKSQDFSHLISKTEKAQEFLKAENDIREIELYNANLNSLRYLKYEYFLEFKDIKIDKKTNTASVKVIEGNDVVFECHPDITSKMRNLEHTITLIKTDDGWEIENDIFFDTKRAGIEASIEAGLSKEEIMEKIRLYKEEEKNQ